MLYLRQVGEDTEYLLTVGKTPDIPTGVLRERGKYDLVYQGECLPKLSISGSEIVPTFQELRPEGSTVRWRLEIEDHAGEIALELEANTGESLGNWMLDVAPHPGKLGRDSYYELLEDLNNKYEGLVFDVGSAYTQVYLNDGFLPRLAVFFLLKTFIVPLERSFRAIEDAPQRILIAERSLKKLHQIRRFDNNTLRQAARIPGMMKILLQDRGASLNAKFNPLLDTSIRKETFNTPANRHLLITLNRLCQAVSDVERGFTAMFSWQRYGEAERLRIKKYLSELLAIKTRIEALTRTHFLQGLTPAQADIAAILAIAGKPTYSRFDHIARLILFPQANLAYKEVSPSDPAETTLQLRSTWEIYELWVFLSLVEIVQEIWPTCRWRLYEGKTGSFVFNFDYNTKVIGQSDDFKVVLTYQKEYKSFAPGKQDTDNFFSISKAFRPDFTISIDRPGVKKLIILLKFRTPNAMV